MQILPATAQDVGAKWKLDLPTDLFKPEINIRVGTTYLGRLVEKARRGEAVYIVKGGRRFVLQEVPEIDPIPIRPPNYFLSAYGPTEIAEDNQLAKASVIRAPKDLE